MAIVLTPATEESITLALVRRYFRDFAGDVPGTGLTNNLYDNVEFSDDDIDLALTLAVSAYNSTPPLTGNVPFTGVPIAILMDGIASKLSCMEAQRQLRNMLTNTNGDLPTRTDDKFEPYSANCKYYRELFETRLKEYKIAGNMEAGWGFVSSGYMGINTRYLTR